MWYLSIICSISKTHGVIVSKKINYLIEFYGTRELFHFTCRYMYQQLASTINITIKI